MLVNDFDYFDVVMVEVDVIYFLGIIFVIFDFEQCVVLLFVLCDVCGWGKVIVFDFNLCFKFWVFLNEMIDVIMQGVLISDIVLFLFEDEVSWFNDVMLQVIVK